MKTLKLLFLLLFTVTLGYSQDITVLEIVELNDDLELGENCSNTQPPKEYLINNPLNMNGYEIELENAILIINGNLYAGDDDAEIEGCGNSSLCITGNIIGEVEIEDVALDCSTLSNTTFDLDDFRYSYNYETKYLTLPEEVKEAEIYDLNGKRIMVTNNTYVNLSQIKNRVVIVRYITELGRGSFKLLK